METEAQVIKTFSNDMADKMARRKDRYQEFGWKTMDQERLLKLLKEEVKEFQQAKSNEQRRWEAVDIANYAMMLWAMNYDTD